MFLASAEDFRKIPGSPIAYFTTDNVLSAFTNNKSLEDHGLVRQGASTSDNDRFLRLWFEITHSKIGFGIVDLDDASRSGLKWFPYNKGGSFRKWYGNQDFLINYENDGMELKEFQSTLNQGWTVRLKSREYYFKESVSWPKITAGTFSARYYPIGFIFDVAGCCYFPHENVSNKAVVALLNSRVVEKFLQILSPTLNFEIEQVKKVPFINLPDSSFPFLDETFKLARTDWDNFETSWNFCNFPLLRLGLKRASLETSWQNWEEKSADAIRRMQELETENNLLFINAYGLADEMKPDVPVDQITLARADVRKDMAAFLSYAIGCMMGRYSLDHPGLILADAGDTIENYLKKVGRPLDKLTFAPDADGVIPILDGEWFEDDIVARAREFLRATFGKDTLEANLRFIEESLGKDLRTYFLKDFYKDHIQTYKKRPIYWMFSSPKNSFNVLIYLHRYRLDTASIVLNDYLREFRTKVSAQKEHQEAISASATASASTKTKAIKDIEKLKKILDEINEYERDTLYPLATKKIAIDLDDGVKVNYCKFGNALRKIPGLDESND